MKREPTEEEIEKINRAIFSSDRVEAINIYISIKECGLTEAQNYIKTLSEQLRASEPEKFTHKAKKKW